MHAHTHTRACTHTYYIWGLISSHSDITQFSYQINNVSLNQPYNIRLTDSSAVAMATPSKMIKGVIINQ